MGPAECVERRTVARGPLDPAELAARRRERWMGPGGLVDRVAVIDSDSVDGTARAGAEAGAEVHAAGGVLPASATARARARRSGRATRCSTRTWWCGWTRTSRPSTRLQPLAGEAAGRRRLLAQMPFFTGYAVEIGPLVGLLRRFGLGAIAQVDLGRRAHRNQPTAALGRMAHEITRAVLDRLAAEGRLPEGAAAGAGHARPRREGAGFTLREEAAPLDRRPPPRRSRRGLRRARVRPGPPRDTHPARPPRGRPHRDPGGHQMSAVTDPPAGRRATAP